MSRWVGQQFPGHRAARLPAREAHPDANVLEPKQRSVVSKPVKKSHKCRTISEVLKPYISRTYVRMCNAQLHAQTHAKGHAMRLRRPEVHDVISARTPQGRHANAHTQAPRQRRWPDRQQQMKTDPIGSVLAKPGRLPVPAPNPANQRLRRRAVWPTRARPAISSA